MMMYIPALEKKTNIDRAASFFKNNILLVIAFIICCFLVFFNLGRIEFWGEDEAQTLLYASRLIIGLKNHSLSNATAFYGNATLSSVMLVQVPFILLLGATELASRLPAAIITVLTLFVIYGIGRLFLGRRASGFLALAFSVSGAVGLFKSSIGVGFYIFFILLGFYCLERYFYGKDPAMRGKPGDLHRGILSITAALIMVPDAYFFLPFFFILLAVNFRKIGAKRLIKSLIAPLLIFGSFIYFEFFLPRKLIGVNNATYEHFLGRKEGLELSFNLREFFLGYINNFSIYFVIVFIAAAVFLAVMRLTGRIRIPGIIWRAILLFSLHFVIWMFLTKSENGHLANSYPAALFIIAFAFQAIDGIAGGQNKAGERAVSPKRLLLYLAALAFICLNFYHTFVLYNCLSLDKDRYPGIYLPSRVPAGYVYGHKLGIKSAAYLLREDDYITGGMVSHYGTAFNFIYMGGEIIIYNTSNAIEYMMAGDDISQKYRIRYIGISPDFHNRDYLEYVDSKGFKKIIIRHDGRDLYYIYDHLTPNGETIIIGRDEYDREYNRTYSRIDRALPYFDSF